ncbi:unnamed protein product [Pocillopora meandrina]|uniref:Uncharacterized protein n=1 Tax=Pocillopora meandrina TaxID=46732 RepID=A0AAU9VRU2_9CNID|nr:unnamed protein product [Pocillopora meandrina]
MSSDAIDGIITKAETKKTKESTKWALRVFEGDLCRFLLIAWCTEKRLSKNLHEMSKKELDKNLRYFYAEARTRGGALYSRSSLLGLRNANERYLNNPPFNRGISITKGTEFQSSNKLLQSMIKLNKREHKIQTSHSSSRPSKVKVVKYNPGRQSFGSSTKCLA